jgi:transcriptional regulator with XRE-family HTH domain
MSSIFDVPSLMPALRLLSNSIQELPAVPSVPRRSSQETFGDRLARLRKLRGFTQRSLASKSGVSNRMIAYYETHEFAPPGEALAALARALDVPMDELLGLKASASEAPSSTSELRLWRQLRQIEKLPDADRKAILRYVDALLTKQSLQQKIA